MKNRLFRPWAYLGLALILGFSGNLPLAAQNQGKSSPQGKLEALGFQVFKTPQAIKDFSLQALNGGEVKLSALRGKVVLLNFWATWCPPCKAEMPSIQRLWDLEKTKAFAIMAVSVGESTSTVANYIKANRFSYPIYLDPQGSLGDRFGVQGIPTTYIINKEGLALARIVGGREYDEPALIAALEELMAAPAK